MIHYFVCVNKIHEPYAREVCKPILDHQVETILTAHRPDDLENVTFADNMDDLIGAAKCVKAEWGIFSSNGTIFNTDFHVSIYNSLKNEDQDTVLIGHILDRGKEYYELHHQTFVVNLRKLRETAPMDIRYTTPSGHKQRIQRSDENFHDDYTPVAVGKGQGVVYVGNPRVGGDLIAWAVKEGHVRPFTERERSKKAFLYPNYDIQENAHQIENVIGSGYSRYYMFNTETAFKRTVEGQWDNIIIPASGFLPFELLRDGHVKDTSRFVFYDSSTVSMTAYKFMFREWDGTDPHELALMAPQDCIVPDRGSVSRMWDAMMDQYGGKSEWLSVFKHMTKTIQEPRFLTNNIMRDYNHRYITEIVEENPAGALMSLSNIYSYAPTSVFRDHKYRTRLLEEQMAFWKANYPEMMIHYAVAIDFYTGRAKDHKCVPTIDTSHWHGDDPIQTGLTLRDIITK